MLAVRLVPIKPRVGPENQRDDHCRDENRAADESGECRTLVRTVGV